jgi:hypothetical protein
MCIGVVLVPSTLPDLLESRFAGPVEAIAETLSIRGGQPHVAGWVAPVEGFEPPYRVGLVIGETVIELGWAEAAEAEVPSRPDVYGFQVTGGIPWPPKLAKGQTSSLIISSTSGSWAPLPVAPRQSPLVHDYRSERAFIEHVQSLSGRPKDKETVVFHARKFLEANPDRPLLGAAALTVLGYRVLDQSWIEEGAMEYCVEAAQPVLDSLIGAKHELGYRWFISLSLVCHYLHLSRGDRRSGLPRLRQVYDRRGLVTTSPPQGTNLLKAIFHLGTSLWKEGEQEEAGEILLSSKETFRTAAALWRFENYHSASELVVLAMLARACLVWHETAKQAVNGTWGHPSYASAPQDLSEFTCLGFPSVQFMRRGLI